jgi:NADH-quinone oxidoreductase subunit C
MKQEEILELVITQFLGEEIFFEEGAGDPPCVVPAEKLAEIARFLREEENTNLDYLVSVAGFDTGEKLGVTYIMTSIGKGHLFNVKVYLPRDDPHIESVSAIWPAAVWYEREIYDLYGIRFDNHPDLRRLLMPEDWTGHPLRKDYVQPPEYHGIPTSRPDPFALYGELEGEKTGQSEEKIETEG